ncbi:MAG TPA: hypothetical protein VHF22_07040 [Planctomycetota bacterium]|nr:hypothetical protein [Planctomycetota bacterium]
MSRLAVWCLLLAFAAHVLVTTVSGGIVVCFEADGSITIEVAAGDRCDDPLAGDPQPGTRLSATRDCSGCIDVPLASTMASRRPDPSTVAGAVGLALDLPATPETSGEVVFARPRVAPGRAVGAPSGAAVFLRTIVILC